MKALLLVDDLASDDGATSVAPTLAATPLPTTANNTMGPPPIPSSIPSKRFNPDNLTPEKRLQLEKHLAEQERLFLAGLLVCDGTLSWEVEG